MVEIVTLVGTVGMILLLIAFIMNLWKVIMQDSVTYNLLNVLGCAFLTYYAYALESYPFLVLEIVWGGFAAYKLIQVYSSR